MTEPRDEEWLRGTLAGVGAATGPTAAAARVDGARAVARRRTRARRAGAAAVVIAIVGAGTWGAITRGTDEPPAALAAPASCPPDHTGGPGVQRLPDDPVEVTACLYGMSRVAAPTDRLTTGLDRLVAGVNEGSAGPPPRTCLDVGGPDFVLRFAYADGSAVEVHGQLGGCAAFSIGGDPEQALARSGAPRVWELFQSLVREQRLAADPPDDVDDPPSCAAALDDAIWLQTAGAQFEEARTARLCVYAGTLRDQHLVRDVPLPADDLAVLVADHDASAHGPAPSLTEPCASRDGVRLVLSVVTTWGDVAQVWSGEPVPAPVEGRCLLLSGGDDQPWSPGPEAGAVLARLAAGG